MIKLKKILCPRFIKKENEFTGLIRHLDGLYDRSHSFNKNIIIFMDFVSYKYLNVEISHLKIISIERRYICKHLIHVAVSGSEKTFKLESVVTEYGELLIFL